MTYKHILKIWKKQQNKGCEIKKKRQLYKHWLNLTEKKKNTNKKRLNLEKNDWHC